MIRKAVLAILIAGVALSAFAHQVWDNQQTITSTEREFVRRDVDLDLEPCPANCGANRWYRETTWHYITRVWKKHYHIVDDVRRLKFKDLISEGNSSRKSTEWKPCQNEPDNCAG